MSIACDLIESDYFISRGGKNRSFIIRPNRIDEIKGIKKELVIIAIKLQIERTNNIIRQVKSELLTDLPDLFNNITEYNQNCDTYINKYNSIKSELSNLNQDVLNQLEKTIENKQ